MTIYRRYESAYDSVKFTSWKDPNLQNEIRKAIDGITIDKSATTDKELRFDYKGKHGSVRMQGYMMALDFDLDDGKPATMYPLKDKKTATISGVLDTLKTTFSRQKRVEGLERRYESKSVGDRVLDNMKSDPMLLRNIEYSVDKVKDVIEEDGLKVSGAKLGDRVVASCILDIDIAISKLKMRIDDLYNAIDE